MTVKNDAVTFLQLDPKDDKTMGVDLMFVSEEAFDLMSRTAVELTVAGVSARVVSLLHLIGWPHRGFTTIVIAHVTFCTAYVTITVQSRLQRADRSLEEAAQGVPHGTIRATTAGEIRSAGGTVQRAPELTRTGVMNEKHVNICQGSGPCAFGPPQPNPVPKVERVQ